jgi:hypothetical protein
MICSEYDAEPSVVRADLDELLGSLEGAALIGAAIETKS